MYCKAVGPERIKFHDVGTFAGKYVYKNMGPSKYQSICSKHADKLLKNVIFILALVWISHILCVAGTFYAFFFQNQRITLLATNLPFFEKDSDLEFTVNMIIQSTQAVYSLAGNCAIELATCAINNTILMIPDLIRFNLMEFDEQFSRNRMNVESIARFRNVFMQIQDFNK